MISDSEIEKIARSAVEKRFPSTDVEGVLSEAASDSDGRDAIRITIVIRAGTLERASEDAVLDTLIDIRRRLELAGDDRFPIVDYSTREELTTLGDT